MTNENYIVTRDALIRANEGFSTNVYFDTNGIPTVGTGVASKSIESGPIDTHRFPLFLELKNVKGITKI